VPWSASLDDVLLPATVEDAGRLLGGFDDESSTAPEGTRPAPTDPAELRVKTERTQRSNTDPAEQTNPALEGTRSASEPARRGMRMRSCRVPTNPAETIPGRASKRTPRSGDTGQTRRAKFKRTRRSRSAQRERTREWKSLMTPRIKRPGDRRAIPETRPADGRRRAAQAGAGAGRSAAIPCQVVRPSSRRGPIRASAAVRSARLSRLCTARKSSTCLMIAREPAARGA
jgi:hypothetical protein